MMSSYPFLISGHAPKSPIVRVRLSMDALNAAPAMPFQYPEPARNTATLPYQDRTRAIPEFWSVLRLSYLNLSRGRVDHQLLG